MAKKKTTHPTAKREVSVYFPTQMALNTNEEIKGEFQALVALLSARKVVQLLDQRKMSNQTLLNALMVWAVRKGAKPLEKELAPIFDELGGIVAEEMKTRGRSVAPEFLPPSMRGTQRDEGNGEPDGNKED